MNHTRLPKEVHLADWARRDTRWKGRSCRILIDLSNHKGMNSIIKV